MKTEKYNVTGMTCAACQANVTRCVQKLEGVEDVNVSLLANQMTVSYDEAQVHPEEIIAAVQKIGYGAALPQQTETKESGFRSEWQARKDRAEESRKSMKHRLVTSVVLLIPLMYVAMGPMMGLPAPSFLVGTENALISALTQLLITIPILFINRHFSRMGSSLYFIGRPIWILWLRLDRALRSSTGFLPCSEWPTGSAMGIWRWCMNTHMPSILNPPQ